MRCRGLRLRELDGVLVARAATRKRQDERKGRLHGAGRTPRVSTRPSCVGAGRRPAFLAVVTSAGLLLMRRRSRTQSAPTGIEDLAGCWAEERRRA